MSTAHESPDSAELAPPQDDLATRKMLGPYELKKKLGQGGMGAVYLAIDPNLKRQIALKILPREKAINPQLVKRFKAEAQNASQLAHDNIVAVYGAGEADGYLYIALEFIDGIDVHDLVERRGVLPVKRSIDIIKQVARALQHALDQGIVHRDIKPANLLIRRDGMVKLADMGLARAVDETMETSITRAGTTVGTVDYMSPEQARNSKSADVRSDMYSLGCTWYHMLTGQPPFAEGSLTNKLTAHAKQPPPDARDKNPAVTEGVVAVMQRMLAKDPDERYQTPAELIKDLEGALVNKDAVSRKILEAIADDSEHGNEDDDPGHPAPHRNSSHADDSYPVAMQWDDSVAEAQAFVPDSTPSTPTHAPSTPTHAPASGRPSGSSAPRHVTREEPVESEPIDGETRPTGGKVKPPAPNNHNYTDTRQTPVAEPEHNTVLPTGHKVSHASHKPTSPQHRPSGTGGSSKASPAPAKDRRSLPPPTRKTGDDSPDKAAGAMSKPLKIVVTVLGIAAAVGLLIFLANLAQNAGETVAPPAINPVVGGPTLPPPPPAVSPVPAGGEAVAGADAQNPTAKDVLIERNNQLDANAASGPGGATAGATTQNIAATKTKGPGIVPDWVDTPLPTGQVPMFSVRKGATVETERRYGSLKEALQSVGPEGARIVLFHDGPFDLTPTLYSGGMLVIEAAQGARPMIKLVAEGEPRNRAWLDVAQGTLVLDGVNLVGDGGAVPVADPWSWVRVTDGNLYVRQSSFTLTGKRSAPTTALSVAGVVTDPMTKAMLAPHVLLDHTVIRGDGLQGVHLGCPKFDGVIRRSLLIAGGAAAVVIHNGDKASPDTKRQLRFVNSTISSSSQALSLSAKSTTNPIETELVLHESLFAAPIGATQPVLLSLEEWPENKSRGAETPPYKNLRWSATGSAILGFRPLIKLSSNEAANVVDGPAWKKLWREHSTTTFSALNWPIEVSGGIAEAPLKSWSLKSLDTLALSFPTPNVTPGCPVSELQTLELANSKSSVTQPQRPRAPVPFVGKTVQQVDLAKSDLGKFIGSKDWEDGTVFVASGSGQRYSTPITVEGRKWRIQFRQTEGPTLLIAPRAGPRSGGENGAFITIRGAQLDIEHGSFNYDLKDQMALTPWFLYAEGGGFSLSKCRIVMASQAANRNRGLFRWVEPATSEKAPPDNEFANFCQITDSLLVSNGTMFSADLARRAILLKNSAFISRQQQFELNVGLHDGQAPAAFDAQNCTYLTGGTQWSILSRASAGANPLPTRFGLYDCVFGTLMADANSKSVPLLMSYKGDLGPDKQVVWYEEGCGYSPELKTLYSATSVSAAVTGSRQDFEAEWTKRWGADRVQRPLLGADGVLFEKGLAANFTQVKPENLTFHKTAKGRTHSEAGGPIGVRAEALEPPPAPPRTAPGSKKPASKVQPKVVF